MSTEYLNPNLTDKIAIVTGGSKGIGREIALKLYSHGASVAICARTQSDIDSVVSSVNNFERFIGHQVDVTNKESIKNFIQHVKNTFGSVDILINNAGTGSGGPFWEGSFDNFWNTIEVNLKGPMYFSYEVLPDMVQRNTGLIVNMGSYLAIRPADAIPYSISKAGFVRFTDSLALQVDKYNINVFTVSPGLVLTDMTRELPHFKSLPADAWSPIEKIANLIIRLTVDDVKPLNGRFIHVNDNVDELLTKIDEIKKKELYTLRLHNLEGLVE